MKVSPPGGAGGGLLGRINGAVFTALCLALVGLIGAGDYLTGFEIDFTVFYTIPIALITWRLGLSTGILFAVLSKVSELWAEWSAGLRYTDPWAHFWNPILRFAYFLIIVTVFHRLRLAYRREQSYGREDALTGLPNSRALMEAADHELRRLRRLGGPISLLYLDCDDFKAVNDQWGHSAGDSLLCFIGGVLKVQVRETDTPARIGGDEFAVLLPGADEAAVREVADRVKAALEAPTHYGERGVMASIGAVTFLTPPASVETMLHAGDALMYEAKAAGKASIRTGVIAG